MVGLDLIEVVVYCEFPMDPRTVHVDLQGDIGYVSYVRLILTVNREVYVRSRHNQTVELEP